MTEINKAKWSTMTPSELTNEFIRISKSCHYEEPKIEELQALQDLLNLGADINHIEVFRSKILISLLPYLPPFYRNAIICQP